MWKPWHTYMKSFFIGHCKAISTNASIVSNIFKNTRKVRPVC